MRLRLRLFILLVQIFVVGASYAQTVDQRKEFGKVSKFFKHNFPKSPNLDSAMVFGFSFLAEVEKDAKGMVQVRSLSATDTIAYRIYPGYKFFETIDFAVFMKDRKEAIFVFPIFVQQYDASYKEMKFDEPVEKVRFLFPYDLYDKLDDITRYVFFPPYITSVITKY